MFTRCPECETTFRLSAADLRRAQGRVRCGDCETVFNALEFLAEEPTESERKSRPATQAEFARPAPLTNQAAPVGDGDGSYDRDEPDAYHATTDSHTGEAWYADDNGQDTEASILVEESDGAAPSAGSDAEWADDEQESYLFDDDDYDDEDDAYSNSGILVTDADFELPEDWHDRSIVDYAVAREASVKASPANEIWPDEQAVDDEEEAPRPADSWQGVAAESVAADSAQESFPAAGQDADPDTREQTAQEPVLFALPEYPEDQEPEVAAGTDVYEAGTISDQESDGEAFIEIAAADAVDDVDPGSLTQQLRHALDAGKELPPTATEQPGETLDIAAAENSGVMAPLATAGCEESAEADTETTAEQPLISFAEADGAQNRQPDGQPVSDANPSADPWPSGADSAADDAEFEAFEIWDADADDPTAAEAAEPAVAEPSGSAQGQLVAAEADADEFDDSAWERIPGVGSNEPVAAVIEDSLFARTGAGWDISQALAGPATEPDQPDDELPGGDGGPELDATSRQDDDEDDADESTTDDRADINLTDEFGYSDSERWQGRPDSGLPGFRDEFEPIEATRADLLEFNAPEDTWSSIFAAAQIEDPSAAWLDEDEDKDENADWPALGFDDEGEDLGEGLAGQSDDEEYSTGQWAKGLDSAHSEAVLSEDDPLREAASEQPAADLDLEDADPLQYDSAAENAEFAEDAQDTDTADAPDPVDAAGVAAESDAYPEDTELPEGFAADDYDVQHIVLEDQNDLAGLTQTFEQAPHAHSEAPPWHAEKYEADAEKPSRKGLWLLASMVLIAALATQLVHYNRDGLAAHPTWGSEVRRAYAVLGMDVYPDWSVRSYEIRGSEAVAGESGADIMDIRAQIASIDNQPTGLPYLRVVLRDRWSNPIAAQHFSPPEYAATDKLPADGIMQPNQTLAAHVSIEDPGAGAQGFELELCIPRRDTGLECTGQPFK